MTLLTYHWRKEKVGDGVSSPQDGSVDVAQFFILVLEPKGVAASELLLGGPGAQ